MRGLGRRLSEAHTLNFRHQDGILDLIRRDGSVDHLPFGDLALSDWGFVYERCVGDALSNDGWSIEYRGLSKGYRDGGLDLKLTRDHETVYAQCKYMSRNRLGKQAVEHILYKASAGLMREYAGEKLNFWLVIPSIEMAFTSKLREGKRVFPVADHFMFHNNTQNYCRLQIREIDVPDLSRVA